MKRADEHFGEDAILFDPIYKPGKGFYVALSVFLAVAGFAVYLYIRQYFLGLGVTGLNRPVFWSFYIVNFVFFIGISHAGTLISAILRLSKAEWRRPITRVAEIITVVVLQIPIAIAMGPYSYNHLFNGQHRISLLADDS